MKSEIVKIDAAEFGLESSKASEIEAMFKPMLEEMSALEGRYNIIVSAANRRITPEVSASAKELRQRYVKIRTGTAKIHKSLKDFYLKGGRFVDAWKNAQLFASQGIEEALSDIENHEQIVREKEIESLRVQRWEALCPYMEAEPPGLGEMLPTAFDALFSGAKSSYEAKVKAEKEAEELRIKEEKERKEREARIEEENRKLRKELKQKQDAENRLRQEAQKEQEVKDFARKAPDRTKVKLFISSIVLPEIPVLTDSDLLEVVEDIVVKFNGFKAWAEKKV